MLQNAAFDRRDFLKGAAAVGGAAAAGAVLTDGLAPATALADEAEEEDATPTTEEIIIPHTACENVTSFSSCTFDMDEPEPLAVPDEWDYEVDVVVAGTGGGLAGAARAAYLGASVIALETNSSYGGTSQEACMYYFATGTDCQLAAGLDDLTDYLTSAALDGYPVGEKYEKHVANCMQGIKDLVAWTTELGLEWEPGWVDGEAKMSYAVVPVGTQDGWNSYRIMQTVENFYNDIFLEYGGEYMFSTPITGLVMEDGAVVGVEATPKDTGEPLYIKANKGVILATGGFTNNISMLKAYCPAGLAQTMVNTAGASDNGEGIRIGLGAGAQLDGYNNRGIFDGGIEGVNWLHHLYAPDIQIARQPWLQVDTMGDRQFYNHTNYESFGYQIAAMPNSKIFSFFDANWYENCKDWTLPMCRNLPKEDMPNQDRWDGIISTDWKPEVEAAIEEGRIKSADTFEELAELLGLPPAKLVAAVEEWNAMVESGDGSEWGYDEEEWLKPLDTPPYYGQALGCMMYSTRCGLSIDENQQVIAKNGELIPGLYAAGQNSGRPSGCVCGDVGYGATSAYLAANAIMGA